MRRTAGSFISVSFIYLLFVYTLLIYICTPAFANDSVASVHGQEIAPISGESDSVRLVREDLIIRFTKEYFALVDVTFQLKNESDRPVSLWVGFPDERATIGKNAPPDASPDSPESWYWMYQEIPGWIENFTSEVDGRKIETVERSQRVAYDKDKISQVFNALYGLGEYPSDYPFSLGPEFASIMSERKADIDVIWKSFELSWKPGETHIVHHTYRVQRGGSIAYAPHATTTYEYTLFTGKTWKGTIGELNVTAILDPAVDYEWITGSPSDEWTAADKLFDMYIEPAPPTQPADGSDSANSDDDALDADWYYPKDEFTTSWLTQADSRTLKGTRRDFEPSATDTPLLELCAWEMVPAMIESVLPESSKRLLTPEELSLVPLSLLKYARNEIYARHGRPFRNEDLVYFFEDKDWYKPDPTYRIPSDDQARLSVIEKKNIALIAAEEQRRRKPG